MSKYTRTPPEHRRRPINKALGPDEGDLFDVRHGAVLQRIYHNRGAEGRAREDAGPLDHVAHELLDLLALRLDVDARLWRRQAPAHEVEGVRFHSLSLELGHQAPVLEERRVEAVQQHERRRRALRIRAHERRPGRGQVHFLVLRGEVEGRGLLDLRELLPYYGRHGVGRQGLADSNQQCCMLQNGCHGQIDIATLWLASDRCDGNA